MPAAQARIDKSTDGREFEETIVIYHIVNTYDI